MILFDVNCKNLNILGGNSNKDYVDDNENLWREVMKQKMGIVCFREGNDDIVAANPTFVISKGETLFKDAMSTSKSKDFVNIFTVVQMTYDQVPLFDKYNVDFYMNSMGLSVNPKYRGLGIGQKLLEAR